MDARKTRAAAIPFVSASALVLVIIGVAACILLLILGGTRNLQHATDAGNLNVAKEALKTPSFPLTGTAYTQFSGLTDPQTGSMDLVDYNRVVGQAYLVALNALADRPQGDPGGHPSQQGINDAMQVTEAANGSIKGDTSGIGQKFYQLFGVKDSSNKLFDKFNEVANRNSMRMFNADGQIQNDFDGWDVSFMGNGDPTNVYIGTEPGQNNLPYIGDSGIRANDPSSPLYGTFQTTISSVPTQDKSAQYLAGYTPFKFGPNWTLYGVPVYPGCQPHHVAGRDFNAAKVQNDSTLEGLVPPNSFRSAASVAVSPQSNSTSQARMEAFAIVGTLDSGFPISIPHGFIVVKNLPGSGNNYIVNNTNNVYAQELMEGIYLATTAGGGAAYSTDQQSLQNWVTYNNGKKAGPMPSADGIFFSNPSDTAISITSMHYGSDSQPMCLWTDVAGSNANSTCAGLEQSFNQSYPSDQGTMLGDGGPLMAVEELKKAVIQKYPKHPVVIPCPDQPTGLRLWQLASDPSVTGAPARVNNNIHKGYPKGAQVSTDGTIGQLVAQVLGGSELQMNLVYGQMAQRMHEIDLGTPEAAGIAWLQAQATPIPLGSTWYIYHDSGSWHFTQAGDPTLPAWMSPAPPSPGILPDGSLQRYWVKYKTINSLVNPAHEISIHDHLYTEFSTSASPGYDVIDWQPSSGYANELGQLTFANYCGGSLFGSDPIGGTYDAPD